MGCESVRLCFLRHGRGHLNELVVDGGVAGEGGEVAGDIVGGAGVVVGGLARRVVEVDEDNVRTAADSHSELSRQLRH